VEVSGRICASLNAMKWYLTCLFAYFPLLTPCSRRHHASSALYPKNMKSFQTVTERHKQQSPLQFLMNQNYDFMLNSRHVITVKATVLQRSLRLTVSDSDDLCVSMSINTNEIIRW